MQTTVDKHQQVTYIFTKPKMGLVLFGVIALVAGTFAGPIQEVRVSNTCARQCAVSNQFNYETGTTYEFTYETELRTAVQGASEDHAGILMKSKAYLDFISKCEMVLRLDDVKLMEHDPDTSSMKPVISDLVAELESNPLTVSFQDGNVEELCLSKPESEEVLNIKRGLLSLIQNNMDDINTDQTVTETDVSGECETEYTSEDKGWYNKLIKKSKNLLGCKQRQASNIAVDSIPYNSDSDIQSLPLIKSTHECEQEITTTSGRLQYAKCQERHSFAPFSRLDSGAITHNTQTLTFVKEFKSTSKPAQVIQRAPIQFQHESDSSESTPVKDLERKLMAICEDTQNGVTTETPNLFTSLVKVMKTMKSSDMSLVYKKLSKNQICSSNINRVRKYFLDAIPMCGTVDSVRYMVELLTTGEITGLEADMWMTTLSFIQNPTINMLAEVKSLLTMTSNQEKSMLSVSSLIHRVCKNNPTCSNLIEVKKLISLMENKIAPSCKITDETLKMSVLALRAIGNAGFGEGAKTTLTKCIQRTENPIEIRLSAIQAFRRMSCSTDKSMVFAIFSNTEEDSEVRIAAYKTLMECPSDDLISKVKKVLAGEIVNQVGSYVWSHLTNLMETSDPHKQSIKNILEDETLKKEFDLDNRKFSRNYEKSVFIEKLNTGATAEADLIWSSQSFIPRSGMLNLTVDLFGNAVNLFEVGGRMEGLEYFFESYFGPNGYFSENDVKEAVEETALDIVKSDKVKRIDRRNTQPMDDLRGSMYMKVFGNELRYVDFQGLDSLFAKNSVNFLDILMALSNENDYQYSHSSMFMDSTLVVPTSSGFPLKLTVNGTATIDLKASGKVDVMKLASSPPTMDVHGIMKPSGAIVVSSSMGIDALGTQIGIKMVSTLHSSTSVQGKITLGQGSVLSVEFDLPEEKQDIISVSSSFYTVHRHSEREQKMITENRQEHTACTGSSLAKITGLELCGEVGFPNASLVENAPYFPMTGPVNAAVTLYKRDKTMKGYKLEARSIHDTDVNIVRLAFSTPDSNIDRSFGADLSINKAEGSVDASFTSPWKKADFTGTFITNKSDKIISGKMNYNGEIQFDVRGSLKSENSGPGVIYTPMIKVSIPGTISSELTGSVNYAPWKYFDTDLQVNGLTPTPISLKSSIQNKEKIRSASASIELSPKQTYSFESSVQKTEYKKKITYKSQLSILSPTKEILVLGGSFTNVYGKNIEVDVTVDKIVEKPITMKSNFITKAYRRGRVQNIVRVDLRSQLVELKMRNKFDNRNGKTLAADVDVTYVIRRFARDNIKLVTKLINLSSKTLTKGKTSLNFASKRYPFTNFKMLSNINHNKKLSEIETDISYGEDFKNDDKQINMAVSVGRVIKSLSDVSATLNGKLLVGTNFRVISKIEHSHNPRSLDSNVMLRLNKDALTASLSLKNKTEEQKNLYGEFQLDYPGKSIVLSHLLDETKPNVYTSTLNAKLGRSKNTIVTTVNKTSASELSLSSSVNLDQVSPFTVDAHCNTGPDLYKLGGSVKIGSDKYSTEATTVIRPGTIQLSTDVLYPARRIISSFEGTKSGNKYTSRADIRWNAERDDTQRITMNANGQIIGLSNIDGSITVQYPDRTIAVTLKNNVRNKITTYASLQWEPKQIITIDATYGLYDKQDSRQVVGSLKLRSPFKILETLDIDGKHQISDAMYKTDVDVAWSSKDTISGTLTVRRPLTIRDIDIDILAKAPTLGYKTITASLQHHINNGLSTIGKVSMNRQAMQIDISLRNKGDDTKTDITGQIDLKTSFRNLKSASAKVAYGNDGRSVDGSALLTYKKQTVGIQTTMKNRLNGFNLISEGEIILTLPSDMIKTTWEHKHTTSEMSTTSETTWDNKRVYINFNGIQDVSLPKGKLSAALEIQTPLAALKDIVFHLNHAHMSGQIDSSMKFSSNGNELATVDYKYLNTNKELTSSLTATNPIYDGTVSMVLTSSYGSNPMTANLEMSLTPLQTIAFDASIDMKDTSDIDATVSVSIPNRPVFVLSASRKQQRSYVDSFVSIEYQPGKVIRLDSTHRTGAIKQMKLKFTSPFTTEYSAEGVLQKGPYNVRSSAMIVAEPYISKWAVSGSVDISNGITGNLKLNTPYPEVSYSEISILSELIDGAIQSSIVFEYLPGKTIKLSGLHQINSFSDMKLTVELTTPFDGFSYMALGFRHQGDWQRFSNFGELEAKGEKITIEIKHMMENGIQSSISVQTPYTEDLIASVSHHGTLYDFESHGEVTFGRTYLADLKHKQLSNSLESSAKFVFNESSVDGSIQFNLEPKITTTISLNTPIERFENIRFSQTFEGTWSKFTSGATVSVSGLGTYSTLVNSNIGSTVSMDMALQTPIKGYRDLKAAFKHQGQLSRFSTHMEMQNGLSQYEGDVKFSSEPAINFEATITTPYKSLALGKISLIIEGALDNFKLHSELQKNKDVSEIELVCNIQKKYDFDLTIKSPYMNTIKASFDHWGSWKKFQSKFNYRTGKDKIISSVQFALRPTLNAIFSIKSPFTWLKNHQLSFRHAGSLNSFKSNMEYKRNGKSYIGVASFQNLNSMKAELNLKGPSFRPINVAVSHDGKLMNFKSSATMSMGKKALQVDAALNSVNGIKGTIDITTPFKELQNINAALSHTGDFANFKCNGELRYNKQSGQFDVNVDTTKDLSASATVSTPFTGFEDMSASLVHSGSPQNFNTFANYRQNGKSLASQVEFKSSPSTLGSASLKSNFESIGNYEGSFNIDGDYSKFSTVGEVNINGKKSSANFDLDAQNGFEAKLGARSPLFKDTDVYFKHAAVDNAINTQAYISRNDVKQYSIQSILNSQSDLGAIVSITTPHEGYESMDLSFHNVGTLSDFRSDAEIQLFGEKYECDITFTTTRQIQGTITIKSPLFDDIDASVLFQGTISNYNSVLSYMYGKERQLQAEMSLNLEGPLSGDLKIISPLVKNIKASFKHEGDIQNFASEAQFIYAGAKTDSVLTFKTLPDMETTFSLSTPVTKDIAVKLFFTGPVTNFNTNGFVRYGGQSQVEFNGDFLLDSTMRANLQLMSVLPSLKQISTKLSHSGDLSAFKCNGEVNINDQSVIADIVYSPESGSIHISSPLMANIDGTYSFDENNGNVHITAPFMEDLTASYDIQGDNILKADSEAKIQYGQTQLFGISGSVNYPRSVKMEVQTPITGYEITRANYKRAGSYGGNGALELNGVKHEAGITLDTRRLAASAFLDSPLSPAMSLKIVVDGSPMNDFSGHFEIVYESDRHEMDVQFIMSTSIKGSLTLNSPLISELKITFDSNKDINNIEANGDISYRSSSIFSFETKLENTQRQSASLSIIVPGNTIKVSGNFAGVSTDFIANADAIYNDREISTNVVFQLQPLTASVSLKSPYTPEIKTTVSFNNNDNTYEGQGEISVDNKKSAIDFTASLQPLKATALIKTTFEGFKTISASVSHNGQALNFNNHAELAIEDKKSGLDMSFNFDSLNGRLSAFSPYFPSMSTGFEFTGNAEKFSAKSDANYGDDKYSFETTVITKGRFYSSVKINTPIPEYQRISTEIKHNGQFPNVDSFAQIMVMRRDIFTSSAKINTRSGVTVEIAAQSAFTPAIQINMKHNGELNNFNTNGEIRIDGEPSTAAITFATLPSIMGSVEVNSPYIYPVSGSFDVKHFDDKISSHVEGNVGPKKITFDGSVEYGNKAGISLTLVTPFEGFENMQSSLQYEKQYKGFTSTIDMQYPGGRIESEAKSSWRQGITSSLSLKTPFNALRNSKVDFVLDNSFPSIASEINVLHSGQKYYLKGDLKDMHCRIVATTPFAGFEDVSAEFKYQGPVSDMQTSARLVYMTGKEISASLQNAFTDHKIEAKAQLETPYTNELNFELLFNGVITDFSNVLSMSMGEDNTITSTTGLTIGQNKIDFDTSLQTVVAGYSDDQKVTVSFNGIVPNVDASIDAKILGSKYYVNTNLKVDDSTSGALVIKTPITHFRDVDMSFEHTGSMRRFITKSVLQYDTDKKIEGSLQFMKYGWRRLQSVLEIKTPFDGFDISKVEYRHVASVDSFECNADLSFMENDFSGIVRASMTPISATISVSTPFPDYEKLEANMKLDYGSTFIDFDSSAQFMRDNTISLSSFINIASDPQVLDMKFTTPFQGYESFELKASNTGSLTDFLSDIAVSSSFIPHMRAQANMKYASLMNVDGSISFNSQIRSLESVSMSLKNEVLRGKYQSKIETTWAPSKTITVNGVFTDNKYSMDANIELTTPFQMVRQLNMRSETVSRGTAYSEKFTLSHNGRSIADFDMTVDIGDKKSAQITIRKPVEILVSVVGSTDSKYEAVITVSKDITDLRNANKISGMFDPSTRVLSLQHSCPQMSGRLDGTFKLWNNNVDLYLNGIHYGYKMDINDDDGQIKIALPNRSVLVKGSKSESTTEGSFMWDADRDETKKIGFRSVVRQSKADITILMPSIGKELQIDSQISMNKGRVLFDGKTEVVYSRDASKKITMMARLEDITDSWSSKNYSFTFGISHPFTSVDIQLQSEIGKSADKISGGINMKYLTVNRDTKTFSVNGEVDEALNVFSFNMDTPMKKININGNAKNTSPYQLSLTNKYDNKRPLTTTATFDPTRRSASFQMNYDLDNPTNEFHIDAKFVNSSAVAAEMYHVINRQRITDALLALRLNTSTLLHSRVHWRPELVNDLKSFLSNKARAYNRRVLSDANAALASLDNELSQKSRLITRSFLQELKPVTDTFVDMYNSNEYHVRDITDQVSSTLSEIMLRVEEMSEMSEDYILELATRLETRLSHCMTNYRNQMEIAAVNLHERANSIGGMYKNYTDYVYKMTPSITNMVNDNYNKYMNQIDVSSVANIYTSTIYDAREVMNNGLNALKSNRIYQQGENAYKFWEIRENFEMIAEEIADWITREIEEEISDIKTTILNTIKSKITVMDIEHGEIQAELHLPIPIKSLDVLPKIEMDYMPYLTKAKSYVPEMPSISIPSTLLPPFEGVAKIQGNTITTFDGLTYNLESSCTYLLARDNTDYNFTVVLNKENNNNTLVIVANGKTLNIYSNGMVSINGQVMELPIVLKDTIVTSLDGRVSVSIAGHITAEFFPDQDLYVVKLNGFYYGKTNGLFGSYDNEPSNDLMTSYGKQTSSVDRFAKTWDVGTDRCQ